MQDGDGETTVCFGMIDSPHGSVVLAAGATTLAALVLYACRARVGNEDPC